MKLSAKKAVCICLILSTLYLAAVGLYALRFVPEDGQRIAAGWVSRRRIMQGNDDPDSPYLEFLPGQTMDINSADKRQLSLLPGIGEGLAESIVEQRQQRGGFSSVDELLEIEGIGEGKFSALQDIIYIGEVYENPGC